ncbi:MAG: nucleoside triphosphate pyrophosphohydrolase [Fimbriimonadaceae bacterium]|nr:nucleoside triphosphate pyrophosphohydrolase [Fimbriimonadaceae bacterium]
MDAFDRLVQIMGRLRAPDGCPWDRDQTHATLREYLLEETCELLEAIDRADDEALCGELGDLLLQIVFHAQIAAEEGRFDIQAVCGKISDKLISRHPHVFGTCGPVKTASDVLPLWEAQKQTEPEHAARSSQLDGLPITLPTLARSYKLQRRAARLGFDWPDQASRLAKVVEEVAELVAAVEHGERADAEAEFGDLLFMVVNVGRGLGLPAEDALRRANAKFERRFRQMEQRAGGTAAFAALTAAQQDDLWNEAKASD